MKKQLMAIFISAALACGIFTGCAGTSTASASATSSTASFSSMPSESMSGFPGSMGTTATAADAVEGSVLNTSDIFTSRDLEQTADTSSAKQITLTSGQDVEITEEGVYVISGTATDTTITVNADDNAKVQLVLDGVSITNSTKPAIYVANADKVFVTTVSGTTNTLKATGTIAAIGEDNVDGVIFSKDDITLNGQGTLVIESNDNGIVGKDDVKITGGTYQITAGNHGIQGKDSVAIADGTFTIQATKDAIHAENSDDDSKGYVYIADGSFNLSAQGDAIEGDAVVQIDGGTLNINSAEGIEGTYVQINGGTIDITASDDGINATQKSNSYGVAIQITGGNISVNMGSGDTDALDSNGSLYISGGTVDITAQFAFDFDGAGELTGGTVTVNGEQVTELTNSMQMGGGMGGMGGQGAMGGQGGQNGQNGQFPNGGYQGGQGAQR